MKTIGPGFVIAATGLGAGDLIAATVAGVKFQTALLWAVLLGALLKGALNEGLARWQLATGSTLLEGWIQHLPGWAKIYFGAYLILWSFLVSAALMGACGLAANALLPTLSINTWALLHSLAAVAMVLLGRYGLFENLMKAFIALMFITVILAASQLSLDWRQVLSGFVPTIPADSLKLILGVIGGVGGSVTLLCYGYWMREKQWNSLQDLTSMRIDLVCAYGITAVFGVCIVILAANTQPEMVKGSGILIALSHQLTVILGEFYGKLFLIGFWGAVFSSMLGVWQGVPYLFSDYLIYMKQPTIRAAAQQQPTRSGAYSGFLIFMAIPPFSMLFFEKPVWLALTYAVAGAFFMPFLAATLIYMNNKTRWLGQSTSGWFSNLLVAAALLLFVVLLGQKLLNQ